MGRGRPRHPDRLTPAEWRVVNAVRHGMTNGEIRRRLRVSLDAVKYHVSNAVWKLGLESRAELKQWHGAPMDSALPLDAEDAMTSVGLASIGQISRQVRDIERAVTWYRDVLGLPHLYTFGEFAFFDCQGVRLFLSARAKEVGEPGDSILYFRTDDIEGAFRRLSERGVTFIGAPHMIHRHASGVEEWMAFFQDVDGQPLALMSQVNA
jgi:catechol 2,3-dioxygenase-like lactoylglutathione lyase family enzyme/DNA-binding CsgD family transcriptional regulator